MPELCVQELQSLTEHLKRMVALQEKLLRTLSAKREAIRTADGPALLAATDVEGALAGEMVALEEERRQLAADVLSRAGRADLQAGASLRQIAALAAESEAKELLEVGGRLRTLVEEAARENSILREAGDRLLGHMRHLSTLMHGALDRAKTYGKAGRMHVTPQLTTTVDISS